MANNHFIIDVTKAHGMKVAKLMRDGIAVVDTAENLKLVADEVTAGGTTLNAQGYLDLFGLPDAAAGAALYPLLQTIMAGTVTKSDLTDFDQGL